MPQEEGLQLELMGNDGYETITAALAAALDVPDPQLVRLTQHHLWSNGPSRRSAKWQEPGLSLDRLLPTPCPDVPVIYYEARSSNSWSAKFSGKSCVGRTVLCLHFS